MRHTGFILFILFVIFQSSFAQDFFYSTTLLTAKDGLVDNNVNDIVQDHYGYMWFGTRNGLSSYDGYRFVNYKAEQENTISHNYVRSLYESADSILWIASFGGGLCAYEHKKEQFTQFDYAPSDSIMPESNIFDRVLPERVYFMASKKPGELWVATQIGLYKIQYTTKPTLHFTNIKRYMAHPSNTNSIVDNKCFHLLFDTNKLLWISSNEGGLTLMDTEAETFYQFKKSDKKGGLPSNQIMFTFLDSKKQLWVGTWENGLCLYNAKDKSFTHFKAGNSNNTLSGNNVYKAAEDKNGNLWLSNTYFGLDRVNLNRFNPEKPIFYRHWKKDNGQNIVTSNVILDIFSSKDGVLWASTLGLGVHKIKIEKNLFNRLASSPKNKQGLSGNDITAINIDRKNRLWVGTWENGINIIEKKGDSLIVKQRLNQYKNAPNLLSNSIYNIINGSNGTAWIGTWEGLNKAHEKNGKITFEKIKINNAKNQYFANIITLHKDKLDKLWVGTNDKGLLFLDASKNKLYPFHEHNNYDERSKLSNQQVYCIIDVTPRQSKVNKELWVGTNHGLNQILFYSDSIICHKYLNKNHPQILSNEIKNFCLNDSLLFIGTAAGLCAYNLNLATFTELAAVKGQYFISLQKDLSNTLWLTSYAGLSRYNHKKKSFRQYLEYNSGQHFGYNHNACAMDKEGTCYIGTNGGLFYYRPDTSGPFPQSNVFFTDLKINNEKIIPNQIHKGRIILKKSLKETKKITLKHTDKNLTIEFSSFNYNNKNNQYAYCLKGYNSNWNFTPTERAFASYTDLPYGNYILCVKAKNADEIWSDNISTLQIKILPPFWKTPLAYFIYMVFVLALFLLYRQYTIKKIKLTETIKFEKFKREKEEELNQQRIQFFTNISHELRTPLTLIAGPLEQALLESSEIGVKNKLTIIKNNSNKLLKLINELLDFRKIELGKTSLAVTENNIVGLVNQLYQIFEHKAQEESIYYRFKTSIENQPIWVDTDKFDKILSNLLSNAFKYTPQAGKISIKLKMGSPQLLQQKTDILYGELPNENFIQINVSNSGEGIAKNESIHIFERFYRVKDKNIDKQGSGIGLSFVKDLILLHKGQIGLVSKPGQGSKFIVRLPLGQTHFSPEQIKYKENIIEGNLPSSLNLSLAKTSENKKILIVEDNPEMQAFICSALEEHFTVVTAKNGREGLVMTKELNPDLIISDIMMPEMDGITFCKTIKSQVETSHTPLILLTAKSSVENNIEGLEAGADDYISKPFSPEILLLRIKNRFETRQKLIDKYSSDVFSAHKSLTSNSTDEQFLSDFVKFIDENLDKASLDIESLSENFNMSKSTFTRKLKQLTNQSPADFINSYKMKLAARLLLSNKFPIKEIAFKVGFSDSRYFATRFKKHFNMTPTEYAAKSGE
jgi:signal transduction histidine kinase/ligand-binding sensor domain-containing protein/DNA-binding response OmpR family regulator